MIEFPLLIRGFLVGLAIAAPVGPIGILCIRRTLAGGMLSGLLSGLGAATADALYASIAAFGITAIATAAVEHASWIRLVGASFLVYLGVRTFLSRPNLDSVPASRVTDHTATYASTFLLTVANPLTILSFVAVLTNAGLAVGTADYAGAAVLVAGVFAGSAAWWLLLSYGVSRLRLRIRETSMVWINRATGLALAAFGAAATVWK